MGKFVKRESSLSAFMRLKREYGLDGRGGEYKKAPEVLIYEVKPYRTDARYGAVCADCRQWMPKGSHVPSRGY